MREFVAQQMPRGQRSRARIVSGAPRLWLLISERSTVEQFDAR
jgi:hypothetical protein